MRKTSRSSAKFCRYDEKKLSCYLGLLRLVVLHQASYVEDVVDAGKYGEGGDGCVNGGEVKAAKIGADGGDEDQNHADDLDEGAGFAEP